jgi:hypothetical protein
MYFTSFFGRIAIVVVLLLVAYARAGSGATSEEIDRLRPKEEKAMAATAHTLIIHAQGMRGPLVSSKEEWHKIACLRAYAALRQCFPENLRNPKDEEFFNNKIAEDKNSLLVAKVLEQYGATAIMQLLEDCVGKSESSPAPKDD